MLIQHSTCVVDLDWFFRRSISTRERRLNPEL